MNSMRDRNQVLHVAVASDQLNPGHDARMAGSDGAAVAAGMSVYPDGDEGHWVAVA